jgi:hypothetical protein
LNDMTNRVISESIHTGSTEVEVVHELP